ncbi:MAG: SMI1/KNR4 family protein [Leptolyngbyaceae cyanobacterium]
MEELNWAKFLNEFNSVLTEIYKLEQLEQGEDVLDISYIQPGATADEITAAEVRLGIQLPPSYKAFLRVSNGCGWPSDAAQVGRLLSTDKIEWLSSYDPEWIEIYGGDNISHEEHLDNQDQGMSRFNGRYLEQCLTISGHGDACIGLLCPEVMTPEGEWEFWRLGSWCGADRWPSFQDWMTRNYQRYYREAYA